MSDHAKETERQEGKEPAKGKPGAWDPEEDWRRVVEKSDKIRYGPDPKDENFRHFFGESDDEAASRRADWDDVATNDQELKVATNQFMKTHGLTRESPLMKKINDQEFYMQHKDLLEARTEGRYDDMLRIAHARATREMELEARRNYIAAVQRERDPVGRETFSQYQKRVHGGR
jgi:hypothetical protein